MKEQPKTKKWAKKETFTGLSEKIKKAKSIAFADYHGLAANQLNQLRTKIKEAGGEFIVAKNTLLSRALGSAHYSLPTTNLTGPSAAIFSYEDEIAPIKTSAESFKTQGAGQFKFGFLGSDLLDSSSLEGLAKIPSPEVLYAKVVGTLNSPIYGVVSVLGANIRNLISVLDQRSQKPT